MANSRFTTVSVFMWQAVIHRQLPVNCTAFKCHCCHSNTWQQSCWGVERHDHPKTCLNPCAAAVREAGCVLVFWTQSCCLQKSQTRCSLLFNLYTNTSVTTQSEIHAGTICQLSRKWWSVLRGERVRGLKLLLPWWGCWWCTWESEDYPTPSLRRAARNPSGSSTPLHTHTHTHTHS